MDINLLTYTAASESARLLQNYINTNMYNTPGAEGFIAKRYKPESPFIRRLQTQGWRPFTKKTTLIRWGKSPVPFATLPAVHNNTLALNFTDLDEYINKADFFRRFRMMDVVPKAFFDWEAAQAFLNGSLPSDSPLLVERNVLTGHSGEGICLLKHGDAVNPSAKLWVRYIKKEREFRVHFVRNGTVHPDLLVSEKLLKKSAKETPVANRYQIRNYQNGWIYALSPVNTTPQKVLNAARQFVANENNTLDFGAIDIIYNVRSNSAYILEVNTAPGVVGRTVQWYANAFTNLAHTHNWDSGASRFTISIPDETWFDEEEEEEITPIDDNY